MPAAAWMIRVLRPFNEHDDAGSVEVSSESDVVHVAVDAQADASGTDSVVAYAVVGVVASGRVALGRAW